MTPGRQDAAPETHCRYCGTRIYPTDARCVGCGRKLNPLARAAAETPPPTAPASPTASEAPVAAGDRFAGAPAPAPPPPLGAGVFAGLLAIHLDCVRAGCTGRVHVPTKLGGEGMVYCPLCRKTYLYVLGRVLSPPEHENVGRGALRRWQLRYLPIDLAPQEAVVTFMAPAELQIRVGDEFVFMHLRDDPRQNVLRNVTLDREFRLQAPPGCFPVLTALILGGGIVPVLLRAVGR